MALAVAIIDMPEQRAAKRRAVLQALRNGGYKSDRETGEDVRLSEQEVKDLIDALVDEGELDGREVSLARRTGLRTYQARRGD